MNDLEVVDALKRGDEATFERLVRSWDASMRRVAFSYLHEDGLAAEVVQESWLAVLEGIERFEGKSSLKHWVFRIAVNQARTRYGKEARSVPLSALEDGPTVDPDRFLPVDHPEWPGHWMKPPVRWGDPDRRAESVETLRAIEAAIRTLPEAQAQVMVLRDVAGFSSDEVGEMTQLSPGNQRVLLHRARAKVRACLEKHFGGEAP